MDDEYWDDRWRTLDRDRLERMEAYAQRWQGIVLGLLGAAAGVGVLWGPEGIRRLVDAPSLRWTIVTLTVVAAVLVATALVMLSASAGGAATETELTDAMHLRQQRDTIVRQLARDVERAKRLAAAGGILLGIVATGIFASAASDPSDGAGTRVLVDDGRRILCGELATREGVAAIEVEGEEVSLSAGAQLVAVPDCGR